MNRALARRCTVDGCGRRAHGVASLCSAHRYRQNVHGDVYAHVPIGRGGDGGGLARRPQWFCTCVDPTLDGLGECASCRRVPRWRMNLDPEP